MTPLQRSSAIVALVAIALAGGACREAGRVRGDVAGAGGKSRDGLRIIVITHGQSSDPFWSVVANGARDAAQDLGVRVEYQAPPSFDMVEMTNLIAAAVASRPHGLVLSIPDPDALAEPIRSAVQAGIPVVSINSGGEAYERLGVLAHIGQAEYEAAFQAGERMAAAGVESAFCVNHEVGNIALDLRCRGLRDALASRGGTVEVLAVDLADPADAEGRIARALAGRSAVGGLLTLGPVGAAPALAALEGAGRLGEMVFATFDLSPEVLTAIRDGQILFAIDQQQYLQGYLPVVLLTKYIETGTLPGGGEVIRTGPGFVTRDNAAEVIGLSARGIR